MKCCQLNSINIVFYEFVIYREYLNLSNNDIANIEADSFAKCKFLQTIDFSSNKMKSLSTFPPFVKTALLNKNALNEWPQFPDSLKILDISENDILTIYNENDINYEKIEVRIQFRVTI